MKILGIDPGSLATGYGLVEDSAARPEVLTSGVITLDPGEPLPARLHEIYKVLIDVIERFSPDAVAVEDLFYSVNVKSLTVIAQVRGVILLAGASCGIPIAEYAPREVKMSVVGRGSASKEQVRAMVIATTSIGGELQSLDAADGIAVALCHMGRKAASV